jgi:hypothetical protein
MLSRDFCYWLQGALELGAATNGLSPEQVKVVQNHLNLVFVHDIDPSIPGDPQKLQEVHDGVAAVQHPTPPKPHRLSPDNRDNEIGIMRC